MRAGPRARWVETVRDPANRRRLAELRSRLTVEDRAYWLGDMTPRQTGVLLEAIERGSLTSRSSAIAMKTIMGRQPPAAALPRRPRQRRARVG